MPSPWHCCLLSLFVAICAAGTLNRTIDDTLGDEITGLKPTYTPVEGPWNLGPACPKCTISQFVDTSQVFRGSWHDATYGPAEESDITIQASFNGTAVYVFHLIPNYSTPAAKHLTNLTFYVDGNYGGQYNHTPQYTSDSTPDIMYQVPVYANSSLASAEHTILIRASGSQPSVVLFDYIVYTTEDDSPTTATSPPTPSLSVSVTTHKNVTPVGLIAGTVAGGVAALTILFCGAVALTRRRVRGSRSQRGALSPFLHHPSTPHSMSHGRTHSASPLTSGSPHTRSSSGTYALETVRSSQVLRSDVYPESNASATINAGSQTSSAIFPDSVPRLRLQHGSEHSQEKAISGLSTLSSGFSPSVSMSPSETDSNRMNTDERVQPAGLRPSQAVRDDAGNTTTDALHRQLTELREEVDRLRTQCDAPPRYE